jgi:hypothetical protein
LSFGRVPIFAKRQIAKSMGREIVFSAYRVQRAFTLIARKSNLHPVVNGLDEILLRAEVAFGGLDGGVAQ